MDPRIIFDMAVALATGETVEVVKGMDGSGRCNVLDIKTAPIEDWDRVESSAYARELIEKLDIVGYHRQGYQLLTVTFFRHGHEPYSFTVEINVLHAN